MTGYEIKDMIATATSGGKLKAIGTLLQGTNACGMSVVETPGGVLQGPSTVYFPTADVRKIVADAPPGYRIVLTVVHAPVGGELAINPSVDGWDSTNVDMLLPAGGSFNGRYECTRLVLGSGVGDVTTGINYHFEKINLEDGLMAAWPRLDEGELTDLIFNRTVAWDNVEGAFAVDVGRYDPLQLNGNQPHTWAFEFVVTEDGLNFVDLPKSEGDLLYGYTDTDLKMHIIANKNATFESNDAFTLGSRHVAVVVVTDALASLYIDGVADATSATLPLTDAGADGELYLYGELPEDRPKFFYLWNRVLSADEITTFYNDGTPLTFDGDFFS